MFTDYRARELVESFIRDQTAAPKARLAKRRERRVRVPAVSTGLVGAYDRS
jgi:hypothetical protein